MATSITRVWVHVPAETVIVITKQKEFTPLTNVEDSNGGAPGTGAASFGADLG